MKPIRRRDFFFFVLPQLRFWRLPLELLQCVYDHWRRRQREKMKLPIKIAIASGVALVFIILVGFVVFPKMIKGQVKKMVTLDTKSEVRQLFVKIPFPLTFKVYMFNVTNPNEVTMGKLPSVQQVGPFCYEEWKEKVETSDIESEDVMFYKAKDTFLPATGPGCLTGSELITIPHPLILGMVNTVVRTKPGMLTLLNKAMNSIFSNPTSIFMTATANEILFDGVLIKCGVKDFAGKAVCTQLRTEATDLRHVNDQDLAFSFMSPKNGTAGKRFKVLRGVKVSHDVGRVLEYDEKKEMEVWPTKECNQYSGTDGTIFPPLLPRDEGLASFAPDLCRSLVAVYDSDTKYDGIPVSVYTATLGDMSKNADEKCYCPTPETCLKKGLMDLFKCVGLPLFASLPHFYESDESYVKGVKGLNPNKEEHGIQILFEAMSGSPLAAAKRLQFSMPLEPNEKLLMFNKLPTTILPLFWVEESVALNNTFTKPLKDLFKILKIVKIVKWVVVVISLGGLAAAAYMFFNDSDNVNITPVHKVKPADNNGVSTLSSADGMGGHVNHSMSQNEIDKY